MTGSKVHPVLHISFGRGSFGTKEKIEASMIRSIVRNEETLEVTAQSDDPGIRFDEVISAVFKKYGQSLVILVDEYDKPILDNLEKQALA